MSGFQREFESKDPLDEIIDRHASRHINRQATFHLPKGPQFISPRALKELEDGDLHPAHLEYLKTQVAEYIEANTPPPPTHRAPKEDCTIRVPPKGERQRRLPPDSQF